MTAVMTARDRLLATLRFEEVDRVIRHEALDADPDTWAAWKKQGWTPPEDAYDFMTIFNMDVYSPAWFGSHLHPGFYPPFEVRVLEDDGRRQLVQTEAGGTKECFTDGHMSIPRFVRFAVETIDDLEKLMPRLDPDNHARVDEWAGSFEVARTQKLPMYVFIPGCFGAHRHLMGFENLMAAYVLDPELIHAMSRAWEALMIGIIDQCRTHGEIDVVHFWEDMCYKNGPMLSPKMFKEYIQPYYERVCDRALEHGATGLAVDTDGDCTLLIPLFMEAGINFMEPFEVQSGMDIRKVRADYPGLVIHGGLDKRALSLDRPAIDAELEAKLPFMLEQGGYVPSIDHVVPPDVPIENWLYFVDRVRNWQG